MCAWPFYREIYDDEPPQQEASPTASLGSGPRRRRCAARARSRATPRLRRAVSSFAHGAAGRTTKTPAAGRMRGRWTRPAFCLYMILTKQVSVDDVLAAVEREGNK